MNTAICGGYESFEFWLTGVECKRNFETVVDLYTEHMIMANTPNVTSMMREENKFNSCNDIYRIVILSEEICHEPHGQCK